MTAPEVAPGALVNPFDVHVMIEVRIELAADAAARAVRTLGAVDALEADRRARDLVGLASTLPWADPARRSALDLAASYTSTAETILADIDAERGRG